MLPHDLQQALTVLVPFTSMTREVNGKAAFVCERPEAVQGLRGPPGGPLLGRQTSTFNQIPSFGSQEARLGAGLGHYW